MTKPESGDSPRIDHHGDVAFHPGAGYNATCVCGWGRWTNTRPEAEALLIEHTTRNNREQVQATPQ